MVHSPTQRTGRAVEDRVDAAARARGWQRLARNYAVRGGELDLVYRHRAALIVVEVRYRARDEYGGPLASVTPAKQRRIIHAARCWLAQRRDCDDCDVRFDVVGVTGDGAFEWVENAFYAE